MRGLLVTLVGLVALVSSGAAQAAQSGFVIAAGPTVDGGALVGVAAVSPTDVWAVGYAGSPSQMLIEHYDGVSWTRAKAPRVGGTSWLTGVSVGADGSVWIAGVHTLASGDHGLVFEWTGSQWSRIGGIPVRANELNSIEAFSATDVWVGGTSSADNVVLMHYDGSGWTSVKVDISGNRRGERHHVGEITALGGTSAAPMGLVHSAAEIGGQDAGTVAPASDGSRWTAALLMEGPSTTEVSGVASSPGDRWIVGYRADDNGIVQPMAWHYNSQFGSLASPRAVTTDHVLNGVADESSTDAWAVGYRVSNDGTRRLTLTYHWDGSRWAQLTSPNTKTGDDSLAAITTVPGATDLWAVGAGDGRPLILHHS